MPDEVTTQVVLDERPLSGRGRTTVLTLNWSAHDPLAVHLLIFATPDHPSLPRGRWVLLRDLLRHGLTEPVGDGDVRIRPALRRDRVRLELRGGPSTCGFTVPRRSLEEFLQATEDVVPAGAERTEHAIDALIAGLLKEI